LIQGKENLAFILDRLRENGFKAYIVGGAVRDTLLGKIPSDVDVLTQASIQEINSLFSDQDLKVVGKSFPICMVGRIEISSGRGKFNPADFPESDLAQRDFTLNAMAYDPVQKKIIDPFHGRKDLEDGIIRFTKDPVKRIQEDPVRMIRACRFAAMIQGDLSLSSLDAVLSCGHLLDDSVARERIQHDILKALALTTPSLFFRALKKTGLLPRIFPSLDRCYDLDGGPHHKETVFDHCMIVGDTLPQGSPMLRLAGFLHDTGKFDAARIKEGHLTFPGHEKQCQAMVRDLETLRFPVRDIAYITALTLVHMRPLGAQTTPRAARRLLAMLDAHGLGYRDFMRMRIADRRGNRAKRPYTLSEIRVKLQKLFHEMAGQAVVNISDLAITGEDIIRLCRIPPGPEVGRIKQFLFEQVLDDPGLNRFKELEKLCLSFQTNE
jgi:tRNA nucleotidyltransferase/poly(A) polymerase